jgi:hypothetical protein
MPRYFFHINDGVANRDEEGTVLKDLATAKCDGVKLAGQAICDAGEAFWDKQEWTLTATDEAGLTLFSLHLVGFEAPAAVGARHADTIVAVPVPARRA